MNNSFLFSHDALLGAVAIKLCAAYRLLETVHRLLETAPSLLWTAHRLL
jgi:hypothetical protein